MSLTVETRTKPAATTARPAAHGTKGLTGVKLSRCEGHFLPEAVQANILRGVNPDQAHYLFFEIMDGNAFRRLIGDLLDPPEQGAGDAFLDLPPEFRKLWSEGFAHSYDQNGERRTTPVSWNVAFTWT